MFTMHDTILAALTITKPMAIGFGLAALVVLYLGFKASKFALKMFAGNYKVAFDVDEPRSAVPAKFRSYATSGKTAEVKSGSGDLQFQLK